MKIIEHTGARLVCQDFSWRFGALFCAAALLLGCIAAADQPRAPWKTWTGTAAFFLTGWVMLYRARTVFDRFSGMVRYELWHIAWCRRWKIPMNDVVSVVVETPRQDDDPTTYRVVLHTKDRKGYPLSPMHTWGRERHETAAAAIRDFLCLGDRGASLEDAVAVMVSRGDRLSAIHRIRAEEALSLAQAEKRVDEIMKTASEKKE